MLSLPGGCQLPSAPCTTPLLEADWAEPCSRPSAMAGAHCSLQPAAEEAQSPAWRAAGELLKLPGEALA